LASIANRLAEGRIQSVGLTRAGFLFLAGVIVVLAAFVGYALQRELVRQPAGTTAEPEAYAAALWPIHRDAKLAGLAMAFAGIAYKTEGHDANRLEAEVEPLVARFRAAIDRTQALDVPASARGVHERYLGVLVLYQDAAQVTLEVARDGGDERLIDAQKMSFRAAEDALRVGDVLWPGEYKPH
jgi:hypothetical protein